MALVRVLTEDEVRDGYTDGHGFHKGAKQILEFDKAEMNVQQGTGQLKTFKQLGFSGKGSNHKPDGWYLPDDCSKVAIILETKASDKDISNKAIIKELLENVKIAGSKYSRVIGILYNGIETKVFLNEKEKTDGTKNLETKEYYIDLFDDFEIDTKEIYLTTMKINNLLHYKFGVSYKKVQAFRDKYKDRGIYFTYSSDEEFKTLFFAHLSQYFLSEKRVAEVKGERHSELKIVGIDQTQHISDEAPIISFVPNTEMTISKYLEKIRALFDDISARKLEKRVELPEKIAKYTLAFNKPVEISEDERKIIYSVAEKLNINITEDFFILGNLSQSSIPTGIMGGYSLNGTDAEEEKYDTIKKLLKTISKALEWAPVENAFSDKKCLKLALQNCGTDIDEDIEISLRIPKNSLLPINEFPKFNNDEMGYLLNDCNMSELFGICSTSTYSDYDSSIVTSRRFSPRVSTTSIFPGYTSDYSDDFESELSDVFCYSCFDEGEEYIVKLKFDYIKHNTTIAFPSIIFINESFKSIPYTITSKNSPEIVSGKIKITDDTLI